MMPDWNQWSTSGVPKAKPAIPQPEPAIEQAASGGGGTISVDAERSKPEAVALKDVGVDMKHPAKRLGDQADAVRKYDGDSFKELARVLEELSEDLSSVSKQIVEHGQDVSKAVDAFVDADKNLSAGWR